jgi:cyclophilin family peptidyl-prolyl cis-trans isomerase
MSGRRLRMLAAGALLLIAPAVHAAATPSDPVIGKERVILRTTMGDLVLGFFPEAAPKTVAQILKLARLGVYDSTYFYRLERNFVLQTANAQDRSSPLTPEQTAAIKKIPGEFNSIPHRRGVLSMARWDNDVNSAETSFSILLGAAPHLDGKYTVFGFVEEGWDVIRAIEEIGSDAKNQPKARLNILNAVVVDSKADVAKVGLRPVQPIPAQAGAASAEDRRAVQFLILTMVLLGMSAFLFGSHMTPRTLGSMGLLTVLLGGFALFIMMTPVGQKDARVAPLVFLGLLGMFRLMSQFETSK